MLTHQDVDHASGLAELVGRTAPVVFAHRECAPYLDGSEHPIKMEDDDRYPAARVDVEASEGVRFDTAAGPADLYHTPGHTPGHVSLHFPGESLLLAGDALHVSEGKLKGPRGTLDEAASADSIGKLSELDVSLTHCFHGGHVDEGTEAIAAIRDDAAESLGDG